MHTYLVPVYCTVYVTPTGNISHVSSSQDSIRKETNGAAATSEETPSAGTPDETVQGSVAERAQAVEALCSLARSGGGGGSGSKKGMNGRSAALAALKAGGAQAQGHERLKSTAEFFLEAGFFAPADGGGWVGRCSVFRCRRSSFALKRGCAHAMHGLSPVTPPYNSGTEHVGFSPTRQTGGRAGVVRVVVIVGCRPMKCGIHVNAIHSRAAA